VNYLDNFLIISPNICNSICVTYRVVTMGLFNRERKAFVFSYGC
jgi:hypothetical protein